jgi:predicted acetyltransferase
MSKIVVRPATLAEHPTLQNMTRFYVYDLSRDCGFISKAWAIPANGLYEGFDIKNYFEELTRKAFLVGVDDEIAGFVLLNQLGTSPKTEWNMAEFFILAKFQGKGIGHYVAHQIWHMHPALWEVAVIPENKTAIAFWRKAIAGFTSGHYSEAIKMVDYDEHQPKRLIFSLDTRSAKRK